MMGGGLPRRLPLVALLVAIVGCTQSRSLVAIRSPAARSPTTATAFRIGEVRDLRSLPSESGITAPDEIRRAVAAYGRHIQLLPEGSTVADVVRQVVIAGIQKAGHRVVPTGDPEFEGAGRVDADIEDFWADGFEDAFSFRLVFRARVRITAPVGGLARGDVIVGKAERGTYFPPIAHLFSGPKSSAWAVVIDAGCENLASQIEARFGT